MKTIVLTFLCTSSFFNIGMTQQILFTSTNGSDDTFWRLDLDDVNNFENISVLIDAQATFSGNNKGPITTSHNGNYYVFQSTRFADNIDGYEALTLCTSDFSTFDVPRDPGGQAFHVEGISQISNDGNTIVFAMSGPSHSRDVYSISRNGSAWTNPLNLTSSSNYDFNISPYFSYDESKIIFEASDDPYQITTLSESNLNGGVVELISIASISGAYQIKSPCYDASDNVIFECETDAERIWKLDLGSSVPYPINSSLTNDNSPVTLMDGRVVSVYIPNSDHQIKMMDSDGSNSVDFPNNTALFNEVFDIGISAGDAGLIGLEVKNWTEISIYPTLCENQITIKGSSLLKSAEVNIITLLGQVVLTKKLSGNNFLHLVDISNLKSGTYFVSVCENDAVISNTRIYHY